MLLRRGRYMIGQDRKNEMVLDQDSVSGRHARLTVVSESEIYVEDCESANGTMVDGKNAMPPQRVTYDSKIEIGQCTLHFQRANLPASVFADLPEGFLRPLRYELGDIVVQGRTSTIHEARDHSLNRKLALKSMLPQSQCSSQHVLAFIREAQITSQLQHPNIPPVYELSTDDEGHLFYATRFMEGETLSSILETLEAGDPGAIQRYSLAALISIFQKICDGVAFAHSHGVVHCALRPESVTVGDYGEVFVMNWMYGLLLPEEGHEDADDDSQVQAPPAVLTPPLSPFSAPAQAAGKPENIDRSVDVYALGGILYKILTLRDPITARDESQLAGRILAGQIASPSALMRTPRPHWPGGHVPEYLAGVAMDILSRREDKKPMTVSQLQRRVTAWLQGHAVAAEAAGAKRNHTAATRA